MPDASSWNQALVERSDGATTLFRCLIPFRLLIWARMLVILSQIRDISTKPFLVFVVVVAAAANGAAALARIHMKPEFSSLCNPWSLWLQLQNSNDCSCPVL